MASIVTALKSISFSSIQNQNMENNESQSIDKSKSRQCTNETPHCTIYHEESNSSFHNNSHNFVDDNNNVEQEEDSDYIENEHFQTSSPIEVTFDSRYYQQFRGRNRLLNESTYLLSPSSYNIFGKPSSEFLHTNSSNSNNNLMNLQENIFNFDNN